MEAYNSVPSGLAGILRETPKVFSKNVLLMASLTISYLLLNSIIYLSDVFYTTPLITDLVKKALRMPFIETTSPEFNYLLIGLMQDVRALIGAEWIHAIIIAVASLFFSTATIIASAVTHGGEGISFKELMLSTVISLKRSFFTGFYITLLGSGYAFLFLENLLPMLLLIQLPAASIALGVVLGILAVILYNYLAVVWILAFVISVMEEKCGIESLGKAAQIVKGMQLHGFWLNLLATLLYYILIQGMMLMATIKLSAWTPIAIGLLVANCVYLAKMFWLVAYTVFYYQCKKTHGQEVELRGRILYTKIPTGSTFQGTCVDVI